MKDIFNNIRGHFTVESVDTNGKIIERYEEDNLITDTARVNMCDLVTGLSTGLNINKFVLGTEGHNVSLTIPKTTAEGFVSARTRLFAEEMGSPTYPIIFTPTDATDANATNIVETDSGSTVHITKIGSTVTYYIEIPIEAANGVGTVAYTEAALYAGPNIFSMKTFGAKVKDESVSLRITWSISF